MRYRHPITSSDGFRMATGFACFQPVRQGDVLATNHGQPVSVPESGLLLMPLYQRQGEEGFFVVRPVRRVWLDLSAALRRWRLERFLHWLPGVRRHPERPGSFIVDRRYARWLALELFHLLGFRRESEEGRRLVMSRRG